MKTLKANNGRTTTPVAETIKLPRMHIDNVTVTLIGTSQLCVLRISQKTTATLLAKHMGTAEAGKVNKVPLQLFKDSYYANTQGFLFPSICFKAACVACANDIELKQTEMRRAFHVCDEFVRIEAPPLEPLEMEEWDHTFAKELEWEHARGCSMRARPVRNTTGVIDIRIRAHFPKWKATLHIDYNTAMISREQLLMLLTVAGFGNGVGEWRVGAPKSKTGTWGRWVIEGA